MINSILSGVEHEKSCITLRPYLTPKDRFPNEVAKLDNLTLFHIVCCAWVKVSGLILNSGF